MKMRLYHDGILSLEGTAEELIEFERLLRKKMRWKVQKGDFEITPIDMTKRS